MEKIPKEPITPEEWNDEVYLTKLRDKLVALRNSDTEAFDRALAAVAETDEFLRHGSRLEVFLLQGDEVAKRFAETLGVDYESLISEEYLNPVELKRND